MQNSPRHKTANRQFVGVARAGWPRRHPKKLEEERVVAQVFIDNAVPLSHAEQAEKEACFDDGFPNWSRRGFQRSEDRDRLATYIQDKTLLEVKLCDSIFKKWKTLPEYPRIEQHIIEGEAKRNKRSNLKLMFVKKIASIKYPMQEFELNYLATNGKVYSEEEVRYLLCWLNHYGMSVTTSTSASGRTLSNSMSCTSTGFLKVVEPPTVPFALMTNMSPFIGFVTTGSYAISALGVFCYWMGTSLPSRAIYFSSVALVVMPFAVVAVGTIGVKHMY
ncbi:hypothetical protein HWV62_21306 [Athelia sp. TMB]|nr:hypothetical protein HWV62_21306 [Athelia sp. TMB]